MRETAQLTGAKRCGLFYGRDVGIELCDEGGAIDTSEASVRAVSQATSARDQVRGAVNTGGAQAETAQPAGRVYYIDWLRILAVLLLFPFHTLRVFNNEDFYAKAATLSEPVTALLNFISVWHMPLLFLLAGCSTYFALQKRSGGQYAWERVKRLLIPFVFGIFILIPPQTWYGGRFNSGYTGSYGHYLLSGDFLQLNVKDGGDYYGGIGFGHLWFILFLFFISLVAIPVVLWGARGRGIGRMQAFSRRMARPSWWPLAVVILLIGGVAGQVTEALGGNFVRSLFLFLFGFVAVCDPKFMKSAERYRLPAVGGGVALSLLWALSGDLRDSLPDPSFQRIAWGLVEMAAMWLVIMGVLGLGRRYLDRTSRTQKYLAEGSYPVYILHQTVIVIIAFYVIRLATPEPVQWLALFVAAVVGTFALYEIVRRAGVLRFLFGMRPRTKVRGVVAAPAARLEGERGAV
jgi:glucan biosynthesis protein C